MADSRVPLWPAPVLLLAGTVAGAILAPSSWWAPAFVPAYVLAMWSLRDVVPEAYRVGWPGATLMTSVPVVLAGGVYAAAVAPFGPTPGVAIVLACLLIAVVAVLVGGRLTQIGNMDPPDRDVRLRDPEWHRR